MGVISHPAKRVDNARGIEVQGGRATPHTHEIGLSNSKTLDFMKAIFWILTCSKPSRKAAERVVGKVGHAHTLRSSMRASFGTVYSWLDDVRSARARRVSLLGHIWWQLFEAACLLPLAQLRLSSPWSNRVVTTDAARAKGAARQGLAYTYLKGGEVQRWARFFSFRRDYTSLEIGGGYYAGPSRCHLHVADFDLRGRHWHEQGCPGLDRHITLEELAAQVWGVEGHLHFPSETEARCLHGGENTAAVPAAVKGRSSCKAMHALCRKLSAISLAGGLRCFWFYIPSANT